MVLTIMKNDVKFEYSKYGGSLKWTKLLQKSQVIKTLVFN